MPELILALRLGGGAYRRLMGRDPDLEVVRRRIDLWPVVEAAE